MYIDYYTTGIGIIIISAIIGMWAQANVRNTVRKYSRVQTANGMTGQQVAQRIMDLNGVTDVQIELAQGRLSDHFDPRAKVVRLSQDVYYGTSVASQAIAAHEVGHVLQYAEESSLLKLRTSVLPVAQFGSTMAGPAILFGLLASAPQLIWVGIIGLSLALLFQLATLPVEFDASNRALTQMSNWGIANEETIDGSREVLKAAAWTYVIAAIVSLLNIIRLVMVARNND